MSLEMSLRSWDIELAATLRIAGDASRLGDGRIGNPSYQNEPLGETGKLNVSRAPTGQKLRVFGRDYS